MAKAEYKLIGDFDEIVKAIEEAVEDSSFTTYLMETDDCIIDNARLSTRVFDRESYSRGNVCMVITFFQPDGDVIHISALTTSGGTGVYAAPGEDAFLDSLSKIIDDMTE